MMLLEIEAPYNTLPSSSIWKDTVIDNESLFNFNLHILSINGTGKRGIVLCFKFKEISLFSNYSSKNEFYPTK